MGEIPETITTALSDITVSGTRCLEAGAGAGHTSAGLVAADAAHVTAVTHDADHAATVRDRFTDEPTVATLLADLRSLPLPDDAFDIATAHGLFNVVTPAELTPIVAELTRVTAPGGWLVVDDYDPLDGPVRDLFGLANAVGELTDARPPFTFYPREHVQALVTAHGWEHERTTTLLDPIPWTPDLLDEHASLIHEEAATLPDDLRAALKNRTEQVRDRAGDGVETGEMYSLAFRLPG
jgi:SAM-dependent methyltransferase